MTSILKIFKNKIIIQEFVLNMVKRKPKILVVEDNPSILFNLKLSLEFNDFEVMTSNDGFEAINILKSLSSAPDVILSDIMMPNLNGYDFLKFFRSNPEYDTIPFIFLSAKPPSEEILNQYSNISFIIKPFDDKFLISTLKKSLICLDSEE